MNPIPQLDPIATPKTKLTLLTLGGGMMGLDTRRLAVSKGWLDTNNGRVLCYNQPRGKKLFSFLPDLQSGAIVLRGHEESRPVFEGHARPSADGMRAFVMDGTGGRFLDHNDEGADALIDYLKSHLVLHTLGEHNKIQLLSSEWSHELGRQVVDPDFKSKLLAGLGPAVRLEPAAPTEPERKLLLTQRMKEELMAAEGAEVTRPLYKIFAPEGAATWLLCSLEADGDTLWAVVDLGEGCVEYGTVSLRDLETSRSPRFKMPMERDTYFDGSKLSLDVLLGKTSLMA